jgi:phenylalanyl-tRNA synthetase beta chain
MKFTLNWLKEHLDTDATLEEISEKLTALGLEVESIEDRAKAFEPFKVAYVEKAEQHPDADRLRVCVVDTGKEKLQVVCGAPNARAGMKGIFAPVGSYVPGTDMTLRKCAIRGQDSNGMLVSECEMGLSDDHDGIIEVADDVDIGTPFVDLYGLDDPVIDIALTPDRADCAGVRGIARDLAAAGLGKLKDIDTTSVAGGYKSSVNVSLKFDKDSEDACPLFLGREIRNVKNVASPKWMQDRLKAIGLRPISALVDITNYLSYDLCRPLHVFDTDKLKGDIHVRLSNSGEELESLNEKTYKTEDFMTAVCDDSGVLALGGIIGGEPTGCTDETVNVFVECAYFDPWRTAKAGRFLQIDSDARYRFERGIDPSFTIEGMEIATRLIMDICGGEASEVVTAGAVPAWERDIEYDTSLVGKMIGVDVDAKEQSRILSSLGFEVSENGNKWSVRTPSWRGDVEGKADLVEEVMRVYGYDNIPVLSMSRLNAVTVDAETNVTEKVRKARVALASRGMNEAVTWSFMSSALAEKFGSNDNKDAKGLRIRNPINSEWDQMRPTILPNLIDAAGRNHDKGLPDNMIFEVGPVFTSSKVEGQSWVACGVRYGANASRHWSDAGSNRLVDAYDVKADAIDVLSACGAPAGNLQVSRDAPEWYHPGRSGVLRLGPNVLANFGELHPALLDEMGIKGPSVVGFEVFLDNIPPSKKKGGPARSLLEIPPFQPVSRDFAFIVDRDVDAGDLVRAAKGADKNLVTVVDIFDVYMGDGVEEGKKSVALNVTLQPREQTLTDADIEKVSSAIIDNVARNTGGQIRE